MIQRHNFLNISFLSTMGQEEFDNFSILTLEVLKFLSLFKFLTNYWFLKSSLLYA